MFTDQKTKMSILTKANYKFSAIPIKIPMTFFAEKEKPTLKLTWNLKGPCKAKTISKNKNKVGGLEFPNFKI